MGVRFHESLVSSQAVVDQWLPEPTLAKVAPQSPRKPTPKRRAKPEAPPRPDLSPAQRIALIVRDSIEIRALDACPSVGRPRHGSDRLTIRQITERLGLSYRTFKKALRLHRDRPDLLDRVIAGTLTFNEAEEAIRRSQRNQESIKRKESYHGCT